MTVPEFTTVVGIDRNYIEQLRTSWPTWRKFQPHLWGRPLIVFYDDSQLSGERVNDLLQFEMRHPLAFGVPWGGETTYDSQRHKMLAGHVFVPATYVKTPYHLKIDADAICTAASVWPDPGWFADDPAWVAPRWNYTKGVNFLDRLDDWGDTLGSLAMFPRLNIPHEPGQLRVGHPRMCSWVSFYRTEFTRSVAAKCEQSLGGKRLPVPSQDTTMWYVAERFGLRTKIANQKRYGWENITKLPALKARVAEIMGQ